MVDLLRPSGALLAALALWAVALLVLGFAGLGGRVGPHPPNAALAPPVPSVSLVALEPRLGPLPDYAEVGARPLLNADRRPAAVMASAEGAVDTPFEATLTSVMIAGPIQMAIVQNQGDALPRRVRLGEVIEGTSWRLIELQPRWALFEGPQGRRELQLRVFDGTGAPMPPAPVASATPGPPAGSRADAAAQSGEAPPLAATPVDPPPTDGQAAAEMTPEQQVEAIRRRIEARRAMRAQEGAEERAATERAKQVE